MTTLDAITLRQIAARVFSDRRLAVHFEVGLNGGGSLRADLVANNTVPYIVICEIKSSPADFRSDKKWHKYLDYCNQFFFCMSDATYSKVRKDIPKNVGVFVIDSETLQAKQVGKSSRRVVTTDNQLSVLSRCSYRAANVKRSKRKNEANGLAKLSSLVADALAENGHLKKVTSSTKATISATLRPYI